MEIGTDYIIKTIVEDMKAYFKVLSQSRHMSCVKEYVEWITPEPTHKGPYYVFNVNFDKDHVLKQVEECITGIKEKRIPSDWAVTALSTPDNILEILVSKGFEIEDPDKPDPGMALLLKDARLPEVKTDNLRIKKVDSLEELNLWIKIVNNHLFQFELFEKDQFSPLFAMDHCTFYMGYLDDQAVTTVMTINNGISASIEFVSTVKEYRNKGLASAIVTSAIKDLSELKVEIVTLRARNEAVNVYLRIGFQSFFDVKVVKYKMD